MPGWGIAADLTPHEVIDARRLVVLRRVVAVGLVVVLLLCVGGYVLAGQGYSSAQDRLSAATQRTSDLTAAQGRYAEVTRVQAATGVVQAELAKLMVHDVDTAGLVTRLLLALPSGMKVTSMDVSLTGGAQSTSSSTGGNGVGTVSLTGTARSLNDLATYSSRLAGIPGVTAVVPATNTQDSADHTSWTATVVLTPKLYSHRFSVSPGQSASTTGGH